MKMDFGFLADRPVSVIGEQRLRHAAVGIPLLETDSGLQVLFERRSEKLGHQPGDVCFPGGGLEEGESPEEAVLREMEEELLVKREQINLLGPLDVYQTDRAKVAPFVCRLQEYDGRYGEDEVAEVFLVPLEFFFRTAPEIHEVCLKPEFGEDFPFDKIHGGRNYPWRRRSERLFFYEYGGHVIWGMTAVILRDFIRICREHGLAEKPAESENQAGQLPKEEGK